MKHSSWRVRGHVEAKMSVAHDQNAWSMKRALALGLPHHANPKLVIPWTSSRRWSLIVLMLGSSVKRSSPVVLNSLPSRSFVPVPEGISTGLFCRSQVESRLGVRSFLVGDVAKRWIRRASFHGREADGGDIEGTATVGGIAATDGGGDEVDQAAKRVTSALELMQTLVNSDVEVIESLRNLSLPLSVDGDEDRLVSEIVRPVLAYAKRYKAPRAAREERQAAKRAAEAVDPMGHLSAHARSPPGPNKPVVDMSPRELREPPPLPPGWDPTDLGVDRLDRPLGYSRRSRDARARWRDPEYRERMLSKRKKKYASRKKKDVGAGERPGDKRGGAIPSSVEEIDQFLEVTEVTAKEAARTYETLSEGERRRREKISMRWKNPSKWLADRLAGAAENQARMNDPEYLRQRMKARSLKAKRAYETRRRNGNSGKGRPRSRVDQARALEMEARAAEARAAAVRAGYATEDDFVVSPEGKREWPLPARIKRKDTPWVKRKPGRPRKVLTEEERVKRALRESHPPRPRGRPHKVRLKVDDDILLPSWTHVSASLRDAVVASMSEAAARAAAEFPGVPLPELESIVEGLAVAWTREVTGARKGEWSPQMTAIAAAGIEVWSKAWEDAGSAAPRSDKGRGREEGVWEEREDRDEKVGSEGRCSSWGHVVDMCSLLDAATIAEADAFSPFAFLPAWDNDQRHCDNSRSLLSRATAVPPARRDGTRLAEMQENENVAAFARETAQSVGPNSRSA